MPDVAVIVAGNFMDKVACGKSTFPTPDCELTSFIAPLSPDGAWNLPAHRETESVTYHLKGLGGNK